jgi:isoquinoline 1-oxidoreductase beta subunit
MNQIQTSPAHISRRSFMVGTSAMASGGLALGFNLMSSSEALAQSADTTPEVGIWVVVKPDDTCVVRVVRSEMGQGTRTGLAQLVAEELECDWSKITTESPTPGQNLKRKRAWGDMSTGGSRGIRTSQDYVRRGGAVARMMLVQAAANEWNVPVSELTTANSIITHTVSGRKTSYGQIACTRHEGRGLERPKVLENCRQVCQTLGHTQQDQR